MTIGKFALIAGLDPQVVNRWCLVDYIDAFEWFELSDIIGMSPFADGGNLAPNPIFQAPPSHCLSPTGKMAPDALYAA